MKAIKDLCIRLINRMTYDKEEILNMISVYLEKNKLTDDEYNELLSLINKIYN